MVLRILPPDCSLWFYFLVQVIVWRNGMRMTTYHSIFKVALMISRLTKIKVK